MANEPSLKPWESALEAARKYWTEREPLLLGMRPEAPVEAKRAFMAGVDYGLSMAADCHAKCDYANTRPPSEAIAALERVKGEMHAAHNHGGHDDAAVRAGYCAAHEERIGIINRELAALRGGEGK